MGGLLQPSCVRWQVWKDRLFWSVWRANSPSPAAFAKGASKLPDQWQKMAMQLLANVEQEYVWKRMGVIVDLDGQKTRQICSFM